MRTESSAVPSEPAAELEKLLERFPLTQTWSRPTLFSETLNLGGLSIELCGLATESDGEVVTGSAAERDTSPISRAYFELVERTSIVAAARDSSREFVLKDIRGRSIGRAPSFRVFSPSVTPARRFARSSGAAVGVGWSAACRAARWELIERDRVLRSWYGETRPCPVPLPSWPWLGALEKLCEWRAYAFPATSESQRGIAAGVFAFPRTEGLALSYGFAAEQGLARALERAAAECLQRLGFLWGEPIPTEEPPVDPTPEYHQEFYLRPSMHGRVGDWLAGAHASTPCVIRQSGEMSPVSEFADLTPEHLRGRLCVVKALPRHEIELAFGRGHPAVVEPLPESFQVHPIA